MTSSSQTQPNRQAVILLGGKGTRISRLYPDRPKALVPVAGRTILEWQLDWLRKNGITHIHLAAGHMADILQTWLDDHEVPGLSVTCSIEEKPLGTGGAVRFVESHLQSSPFYVLNGDSLAPNLDFQSLEKFFFDFPIVGKNDTPGFPTIGKVSNHWKNEESSVSNHWKSFQSLETVTEDPHCVIAVVRIEETGRYGTVEFDEAGRVTAFLEKAERNNGWINTGVYLMNRSLLELIPYGENRSIETEIFPDLVKRGLVRAFACPAPLLDMGTPDGLKEMEAFLSA